MSVERADEIPPEVATALEQLRRRLEKPEIVRLALRQYVISEIVRAIVDAGGGIGGAGSPMSITTSSETTQSMEDDGTGTICHTEVYSLFGHEIYSHTVCDTASATGSGHVTVHPN